VAESAEMKPLRILLVDDSAEFLESAARLLMLHPELCIVGRAASGSAALEQVAALHPDLVLMDLAMPGMNGLETTRQIKAQSSAPLVVIMTLYDVAEYRMAARNATADGFIAKSSIRSQLLPLLSSLLANPSVTINNSNDEPANPYSDRR
jgi:DNA-binding NarL/FixJ family response regulator